MKIEVIRSKRKTCEIKINTDGSVTIKAPNRYSNENIQTILDQKRQWILKKIELMKKNALVQPPLCFELGGHIPIWNEMYEIRLTERGPSSVDHFQKLLLIRASKCSSSESIKSEVIKLTRPLLSIYLEARIDMFAKEMQVHPNQVKVKLMKSRWGSCSSKGNLNFSLNLIFMPKVIVDSVIIHELAHLRELNHSSRFWHIVEHFNPQYEDHKKWLKTNAINLNFK